MILHELSRIYAIIITDYCTIKCKVDQFRIISITYNIGKPSLSDSVHELVIPVFACYILNAVDESLQYEILDCVWSYRLCLQIKSCLIDFCNSWS